MRALDLVLPGDPATLTGGYVYDRRILEGLGRLGWSTRALTLPDDFPCGSPASLRAADDVLDAIPAGRIVVIDGLALADLAPSLERRASRLGLIALVHHPLGDETGLDAELAAALRRAEERAWAAARGIVVTSRWTMRRVAAAGVAAERIRVVEPGTDRPEGAERVADGGAPPAASGRGARTLVDENAVDSHAHRRAPRGAGEPPRLLCVATLTERKGHGVLLDALARIADRPWRLDCVGSAAREPSTTDAIRARIERHGLEARVALRGELSRDALDALYRDAAAFVLPSYLEGYGMALADALAHGLPVVATNAGAIPETVGDAGLLVPPGDDRALAAALARLLDDDALHAALASRAHERGRALPTWADASASFAAAVEALAAMPGRPPA